LIMRIGRISDHNLALTAGYRPGVVDGDLHLVVATPDPAKADTDVAERTAQLRPYATGRIVAQAVGCEHRQLLQAGPAAEVGRIITEALRE
ncbi:hypothetical protein ACFQ1S_29630, partial [Kibdelosporangium lantanae]